MKLTIIAKALEAVKNQKRSLSEKFEATKVAKEIAETRAEIDKIYEDNKHEIMPYVNFVKACVTDATCLPTEEVRYIDYVDLALKVKENYNEYLLGGKYVDFFSKTKWQSYLSAIIAKEVYNIIVTNYKSHTKLLASDSETNNCYYMAEFKDENDEPINFAYIENKGESGLISFYLERDNIENSLKLIKKIFFERFNNNKIIVSLKDKKIRFDEDKLNKDFIMFRRCEEYIADINKFLDKNHNRSILFYGPPGSGKSNIIAGIISKNALSTLKFANIDSLESNTIVEIIKIFSPDCIVLEDLDHAKHDQLNTLLEKLEQFTMNVKLILGSANQVSNLDNALIRPGRFDQAIEVKSLDAEVIMSLVKEDKELFELTKDFPVAYIKELMKRVEVLGKPLALKSMDDIIIRVENLGMSNYSLKKSGSDLSHLSGAPSLLSVTADYPDDDDYEDDYEDD